MRKRVFNKSAELRRQWRRCTVRIIFFFEFYFSIFFSGFFLRSILFLFPGIRVESLR